MLITTPEAVAECISGVIFFEETFNQATAKGVAFPDYLLKINVLPGIKLDQGHQPFGDSADEMLTQGAGWSFKPGAGFQGAGSGLCQVARGF